MAYASDTDVPVHKTKAEIEALLVKHGCDAVATGWDGQAGKALVTFRLQNRMMRFTITMPSPEGFKRTPSRGLRRKASAAARAYDQAIRSRWRGLLLCLRAKLEAIESNIESVEEAFLAQILLPDNSTVGDTMRPQLAAAYETGRMPAGLLMGG